jgi:hypothetical protein
VGVADFSGEAPLGECGDSEAVGQTKVRFNENLHQHRWNRRVLISQKEGYFIFPNIILIQVASQFQLYENGRESRASLLFQVGSISGVVLREFTSITK